MQELTPKQRRFCIEYVKDLNGTQAAIRAGYSPRTAQEQASRLLSKDMVRKEVHRVQEEIAAASNVTVASLLREAETARCLALDNGQASAAVQATRLKGALTGLLSERHESLVERERLAMEQQQQVELRRAADLLAAAAVALGLPLDAEPVDIAQAMQAETIGPTAAYGLRRALRGPVGA